jgi:hypothetical protein
MNQAACGHALRPPFRTQEASLPVQASTRFPSILGTLVLDVHGAICRCSAAIAELLQRLPEDLAGIAVKSLLPALPLQAHTLGYNIAYASFHGHSRRALSMRMAVGAGMTVPVRARVRLIRQESEFRFLLQLERLEDTGSSAARQEQ